MPKAKRKLLVVDNSHSQRTALTSILTEWEYKVMSVDNGESAIETCKKHPVDLVLMDAGIPGISWLTVLKNIKQSYPAIPVIIITAYSGVESAVDAIKAGAYDYLPKPLDFDELKLCLERALDHATLRDEIRALKNTIAYAFDPGGFIGQSPVMRRMMVLIASVAPSDATVLVTGESGTGKELVAKMLHSNSNRRNGPYVTVNCAALTESLLEAELFGHEKGAFTGADKNREGRFFAADKGTIFLDEIGEIPMSMQAKLLRAIQEREIQRVGGDTPLKVDVRIIAATNRDLQEEVAKGRFRQDLYYRLNVVSLQLPPLKERTEDIPMLAVYFLKKFSEKNNKAVKGFTPLAMDKLVKYSWPGNVRELENVVERAVVLLMGEYVSERELPPALETTKPKDCPLRFDFNDMTLEDIERVIINDIVRNVGGNKSEAARRLGITRKTLVVKMGCGAPDAQ